jgi:hypothetical protein
MTSDWSVRIALFDDLDESAAFIRDLQTAGFVGTITPAPRAIIFDLLVDTHERADAAVRLFEDAGYNAVVVPRTEDQPAVNPNGSAR